MIKIVIVKTITVVAMAGLVAGLTAFLVSAVPEAKAQSPVTATLNGSLAKADRLPAQDAACSQAWPQYDQSCKFDLRRPAHAARTVRVIALR